MTRPPRLSWVSPVIATAAGALSTIGVAFGGHFYTWQYLVWVWAAVTYSILAARR